MDFYSELDTFLKSNSSRIREDLMLSKSNPLYEYYRDRVRNLLHEMPEPVKPPYEICATDGSEYVQELYNGKKFVVARAISQIMDREYFSTYFNVLGMDRDDVQQLVKRIMESAEHKAALEAVKKEESCLMIMDGSVSGRFWWGKKVYEGEIGKDFYREYMDSFVSFLKQAREKKIIVLYISKTSETSVMKKELHKNEKTLPDFVKINNLTDHVLIKSIAEKPCYTDPILMQSEYEGYMCNFQTVHVLPEMDDLPMKIDMIIPEGVTTSVDEIISWMMWGYTGIRSHNLWVSLVDKKVKLNRDTTRVVMEMFENEIEVWNAETRGQRRERIRL